MIEYYFVGIDPGKTGAIAFVPYDDNQDAFVYDCPETHHEMVDLLEEIKVSCHLVSAAIEKVSSMAGWGNKGTFTFGKNVGHWEMFLSFGKIKTHLVQPKEWQKKYLDSSINDTKKASLEAARRLFPECDLKKQKDHGKSDALLIGLYLKQFIYKR